MTCVLKGKVRSGMGNFAFWIAKLRDHYQHKTGLVLYPGTLNIELNAPFDFPEEQIIRLEAHEYGGTVSVNILPCRVFGRPAVILRTDLNARGEGPHPRNIIEVATDVKLRDAYNLEDGDEVTLSLI